jgi:hypothetical protein
LRDIDLVETVFNQKISNDVYMHYLIDPFNDPDFVNEFFDNLKDAKRSKYEMFSDHLQAYELKTDSDLFAWLKLVQKQMGKMDIASNLIDRCKVLISKLR